MATRDQQRARQDAQKAKRAAEQRRTPAQEQLREPSANPPQPQTAPINQGGSQADRQQRSSYREEEDHNQQRANRERSSENPTGGQSMDRGQDREAGEQSAAERISRQRSGTPGTSR